MIAAGIAVAGLITGCGSTSLTFRSDTNASQVADVATVNCGSVYDPTELADSPPASSLPDGPAGAVDDVGTQAFDPSQDWKPGYEQRHDGVLHLIPPSSPRLRATIAPITAAAAPAIRRRSAR